jgi:hypothetical protein
MGQASFFFLRSKFSGFEISTFLRASNFGLVWFGHAVRAWSIAFSTVFLSVARSAVGQACLPARLVRASFP